MHSPVFASKGTVTARSDGLFDLNFRIAIFFGRRGYLGPEVQAMNELGRMVTTEHLDGAVMRPGFWVDSVSLNRKVQIFETTFRQSKK